MDLKRIYFVFVFSQIFLTFPRPIAKHGVVQTTVKLMLEWKWDLKITTTARLSINMSFITSAKLAPTLVNTLFLTIKHRETHGCVISTLATEALVLKHQAISIHNAD